MMLRIARSVAMLAVVLGTGSEATAGQDRRSEWLDMADRIERAMAAEGLAAQRPEVLQNVASARLKLGDGEGARAAYAAARESIAGRGADDQTVWLLGGLASVVATAGDEEALRAIVERAEGLAAEAKEVVSLPEMHAELAGMAALLGPDQAEAARAHAGRAVAGIKAASLAEIPKVAGERARAAKHVEGIIRTNLLRAAIRRGEGVDAAFDAALEHADQFGDKERRGRYLRDLAGEIARIGDLERADRAISAIPDSALADLARGEVWLGLASRQKGRGDREGAREAAGEAVEAFRRASRSETREMFSVLTNLERAATLLDELGDRDAALAAWGGLNLPFWEIRWLGNRAIAEANAGHIDAAKALLVRADGVAIAAALQRGPARSHPAQWFGLVIAARAGAGLNSVDEAVRLPRQFWPDESEATAERRVDLLTEALAAGGRLRDAARLTPSLPDYNRGPQMETIGRRAGDAPDLAAAVDWACGRVDLRERGFALRGVSRALVSRVYEGTEFAGGARR